MDDAVVAPTLFAQESGDAQEVDGHDVVQRYLNTCSLCAVLIGLAQTDEGRAVIRNAVTPNVNASGAVTSYTVKLHSVFGLPPLGFFMDHPVTVDAQFAKGHALARMENGHSEIWSPLIEQAYLRMMGGADQVKGAWPGDVMEQLLGKPAERHYVWHLGGTFAPGYPFSRLESDLAAGKVIVVSTLKTDPCPLAANHSYAVTGIEVRDGVPFVKLRNPWGFDVAPMPYDELLQLSTEISVCSPR